MKKLATFIIAVMALVMAIPVSAAQIKVQDQNKFVAPTAGTTFEGLQTVTIQVEAGDLVPGYDTYCEVCAYSNARNGLLILNQSFPVTEKGQIITTTLDVADYGLYVVFTSTKYYVNGFINYAASRDMYMYLGNTIWAGNKTHFKIVEKPVEKPVETPAAPAADEGGSNGSSAVKTTTDSATSSTKQTVKLIAKNKSFKATTKTKKYVATLKDAKGKAVTNVKLTLKVKGKTYTAKTNSKGKATFKITKLKKGKYTATIKFAGNESYKATSKKVKITVK